jgi:peptidyl-prolyl cis-trans isomerase A (cyclophilin A)
MRTTTASRCLALFFVAFVACRTEGAPEPRPDPETTAQQGHTPVQLPAAATGAPTVMTVAHVAVSPDDPLHGQFGLDDATKGLPVGDTLTATIDTSHGKMTCKLLQDKAPITVANFVGLARGVRPWKDPSGHWVTKPAYDGTTFHRIIKGFMIQGGDAKGDGSGEAGYVIPDEIWVGARHDHTGELCMANRGANTNSAQFFITDAPAQHLDHGYTIFGECEPDAVIHMIAGVAVTADKPTQPVTIRKVTITRTGSDGGTVPFAGAPLRDGGHD